ncbi:exosome component Rrp6 isoform X2 [Lasioglossum baleicum]|uniref:exosome component Rrp6 isoform X2 n=1 Tax=Lasioglossum baleicum TaxID=434251 RepID=UPI003FCDEA21
MLSACSCMDMSMSIDVHVLMALIFSQFSPSPTGAHWCSPCSLMVRKTHRGVKKRKLQLTMDTTENWDGDCQTPLDDQTQESERQEPDQVVPGYAKFDDYIQDAFDAIRAGIKAANALPIESNFNYYSCFPSFLAATESNVELLLSVVQHALGTAGIKGKISRLDTEEKFELLLESNDILLDKANSLMDEESGITKTSEVEFIVTQTKQQTVNGSWNKRTSRFADTAETTQSVRLLAGKNIQRPQIMFKDKIDNSSKPWCPKIKDKPNSLKPLAIYLEEDMDGETFNHPYEYELDMFTLPSSQLQKSDPTKYKPLDISSLVMIEKPSDIKTLIQDLKRYKEIAVDLEHHSYRSFQGITCLMQISTEDTDYIIDTLALRSELHELNEIFTKPTILKVFHGADLDVQWLQRDLSLYVVNMFDTHQAAKHLNLPYLSLAYLLKHYCNIDPNKHFQLADWRIRPLPEELQRYAREDTHYLLYIKDILKNALIDVANGQTNILKAVYDRSTDICKRTYVKPVWTEESCMSLYRKSQKMFNNKQLYALREIHKWRDLTAREEDDSTAYVLPNHMLLNIAETLPREMQGILACCNPIPPLVRQHLLKLHKIILKAREQPLIKPILEDLRQRLTQRNQIANSEAWMHLPHDIPSGMEARADLPCLLDKNMVPETLLVNTTTKHTVTVFDSPVTSEDEETTKDEQQNMKKKKFVFVSPFERYKRVIPMIAQEEAQERERQKQAEENRLNKEKKDDEEIVESKNRVYELFKQVSQIVKGENSKKPSPVSLGQMQGRKRKRDSNIKKEDDTQEKANDSLLTPAPLSIKKVSNNETPSTEEQKVQECLARIQGQDEDEEKIKSLRTRKKGDKKRAVRELNDKGLMPSDKFDYKTVDFNSFQGGSANTSNKVNFVQTMKKQNEKKRKRKKQKINI